MLLNRIAQFAIRIGISGINLKAASLLIAKRIRAINGSCIIWFKAQLLKYIT
jgi:hypothetical protein